MKYPGHKCPTRSRAGPSPLGGRTGQLTGGPAVSMAAGAVAQLPFPGVASCSEQSMREVSFNKWIDCTVGIIMSATRYCSERVQHTRTTTCH